MGSNGATASGVGIEWEAMVLLLVEFALSGAQWSLCVSNTLPSICCAD